MTAQFPDILIFNDEALPLYSNPLEAYFDKSHPRPQFDCGCTASWRGYKATWAIQDGFLCLLCIDPDYPDGAGTDMESIFPGSGEIVRATWFTGSLRVPRGKELEYIHLGYASMYEEDLMLDIQAGQLVGTRIIDNRKK